MLFVDHKERLSVTPCFIVLANVLSEKECKQIIEIGQETNIEESKVLGQETNPNVNNKEKIRQSKSSFLYLSEKTNWIFDKVFQATVFVNENYFQFELNGFVSMQFTEYHQGGDFYDWHLDLPLKGTESDYPSEAARFRKLSGSLILSDSSEYTGGNLYVDRDHTNQPKYNINQSIGSVVFFPSFVSHKVDKVHSGIRRSLVFWVDGPKFK